MSTDAADAADAPPGAAGSAPRPFMLISIHPRHVDSMLAGHKRVELRRTRPTVTPGQAVLIYATAPRQAVVARARIVSVRTGAPDAMWPVVEPDTAIDRVFYDRYYAGVDTAVAIGLDQITPLRHPISRRTLALADVHPPQTWRYLTWHDLSVVLADHPAVAALADLAR